MRGRGMNFDAVMQYSCSRYHQVLRLHPPYNININTIQEGTAVERNETYCCGKALNKWNNKNWI